MLLTQFHSQTGLLAMMNGSEFAVWVAIACAVFIPLMANRRKGDACKRGGSWGWVFVVLAALLGTSVFVTWASRAVTYTPATITTQWSAPGMDLVGAPASAPAAGPTMALIVITVVNIAAIIWIIVWIRRRQSGEHGRPVNWGWLLLPMAILVGLVLFARVATRQNSQQVATLVEVAQENVRLTQQSMQEALDRLNKPRIDLEGRANENDSNRNPDSVGDANSLTRSIERLERAAEKVADVADQVSDVGTMIGRAMVALNGTLGSKAAVAAEPAASPVAEPSEVVEITSVEAPPAANAPAWIDDPPKHVDHTWREVIITDEFATNEECQRQMDELLLQATTNYMKQFAGSTVDPIAAWDTSRGHTVKRFVALEKMGIGLDFIRREIAQEEYEETVQRSFGPMKKIYAQLDIQPSVQNDLRRRWEVYLRQERFATVGFGAGSVLSLIGLAYGLLKVDTWTKGYYSTRLFLGVPAAIIGVIALLFALGE